MSNALGIGPAVMINRLAHQSGTSPTTNLAKIAELRMALMIAVDEQAAKAADASPTGEADAVPPASGAEVDRLI